MEKDYTPLHHSTPLIESVPMGLKTENCQVFLKLDNCQPTASFKIRGIGRLCTEEARNGKEIIVCSSGGNAGIAAAYSAKKLGLVCKIFVPGSTPQFTISTLQSLGADVQVAGSVWDEANAAALKYIETVENCAFVHPFDHPTIWKGHGSIIHEISSATNKPDCIVASVGGGGLATGIIQGLDEVGWSDVPVVAMETNGAASFAAAVDADEPVTIPGITSIAKSLGSKRICQQLFDYTKNHTILSEVIEDSDAINACLQFADDHRMLVEPACGASLAFIYSQVLQKLQQEGRLGKLSKVVIIVCGGNSVTMETLTQWRQLIDKKSMHTG